MLFRSKDVFDGATPAANSIAVLNLMELAGRTGDLAWRAEARHALAAFASVLEGHPDGARMMLVALRQYRQTSDETGAGPEEADAEYGEARAAFERSAEAATAKLDHEAEKLVRPHLD